MIETEWKVTPFNKRLLVVGMLNVHTVAYRLSTSETIS